MSIIRRPSRFGDLLSLRSDMDRFFEDFFSRPRFWVGGEDEGGMLPLDVYTTNETLVVKAAMPGIRPEDVDITITGETLTISGKYEEERTEEEQGYLYRELRRRTRNRTLALPADLKSEAATADFENGILTLTIPKSEATKPRQVKVTVGHGTPVEAGEPAGGR